MSTNYLWGHNCCMSTAAEWTEMHGGDGTELRRSLDMSEATAIRFYLKRYGTIGEAYIQELLRAGWKIKEWGQPATNGELAVVGGEFIVTENDGLHYPKELIQVLAFRVEDKWQIWTPEGMNPINWSRSDCHIWSALQW